MSPVPTSGTPTSDVDPYTESARIDPYDVYAELRALGPVVYLSRHGLHALPRYDEVRAALRTGRRSPRRGGCSWIRR